MTTDIHTPKYSDPWAYAGQPLIERMRRGWFRRAKFRFVDPYLVRIPNRFAVGDVMRGRQIIKIPRSFMCDGRSTPIGTLMVRDHPAGFLHDWGYRLPQYVEEMRALGDNALHTVYGYTPRDVEHATEMLGLSRSWWDDLFYSHLRAVGHQQNFIAIDPRRTRGAHAMSRPWQWAAVRLLGSAPFQER